MRKKLLAIALLIFATNLVNATQVWYLNKSGDNYYPKTNVMTAALVGILGQQKTNNFLAGQTISISPTQAKQLTLGTHVTTITSYNPKAYTPPTATTRPAAQTYQTPTTTTTRPTTTTKSTTSRTIGTTSRSRGRTRAAAPTTAYKPPAPKPATTSRTRGRTRGRTTAASTPKVTPTPTATMAPQNGRIQELENKVEQLTNIVLQLQQQLGE